FDLPRHATLGFGIKAGIATHREKYDWEMLAVIAAREANDATLRNRYDSVFNADGPGTIRIDQSIDNSAPTGGIQFIRNFAVGETNGTVELRSGVELNLGELVYLRAGSIEYLDENVATNGIGICLSGFLKTLDYIEPGLVSEGILSYPLKHMDIRFDYAH